jgi:mevalonate kinase
MKTTASAPAKAILFGEHAVVYGFPAVAIPLSEIRAYVEITDTDINRVEVDLPDLGWKKELSQLDPKDPIRYAIDLFNSAYNLQNSAGMSIIIRSDIPIGSGMGSGAASATALLKALFHHANIPYTLEQLSELVYKVEILHHGTPSGIDNTVTAYEEAVFYQKTLPINRIAFPHPFHLVIANSGKSTPTKVTVAAVRRLFEGNPTNVTRILQDIGECTHQGLQYLQQGDFSSAGRLMAQNHQLLQSLTVSDESLDHLVKIAIQSGALGAKLSGGGRGGIVIALVQEGDIHTVKDALSGAGAVQCFTTEIGRQ